MSTGVFGGTFDPPHLGHLIVAQDALELLGLDRLLFVPAAQPPHKQDRVVTPAPHRLAMLRLAVADDPRFAIEPLELERAGPSWTVDTLRELARRPATAELVLLMGADQYAELDGWREPAEVRRLARIAVLHREGRTERPLGGGMDVVDVAVTRIDISSTAVRARVAAGGSIRYLVPPAVAAYIAEHGLYRTDAPRNGARHRG
ncbi:MAG TPA: nicotinate-nucleotide adenylyltransferase [Longimicrobiales bacterium]|nr:nicotinate-nucleotide adenylyltransferase [Longimicrobiales bacterium]